MTDMIAPEGDEVKGRTRRSFLGRTLAATAAVAATGEAHAAGRGGILPNLYPGWDASRFKEIRANENYHLQTLLQALGPNARPRPTFQNVVANNPYQLAFLGASFCNTGAGAYLGSGPYIFDKTNLIVGSSFGQVEAYQSGWLNSVLNGPIVPGNLPYSLALPPQVVAQRIAPYLVSLNGGPPATYDTTPSPDNDIAILNFALILEYLENELYNTYVPRFYGN